MEGKEKEINSKKQMIIQTRQFQAPKTPPYPETLAIEKHVVSRKFNLEDELKNLCVSIITSY